MKLLENMRMEELVREKEAQQAIINKADKRLEAIHGRHDYSDDVVAAFPLGKVGFRRDTKRQAQTLNRAINGSVEACALYDQKKNAESRLQRIGSLLARINEAPEDIRDTCTPRMLAESARRNALNSAPEIVWERTNNGYRHGEYLVRKVDDVVFIYLKGAILGNPQKTVKNAKAIVALICAMAVP